MPCFSPLQAWRSKTVTAGGTRGVVFNRTQGYQDLPVSLPCGQCVGCRLGRSREWAIRCHHEATLHTDNCFVTLTYNDDNLPNDPQGGQPHSGTLVPRDLQLFIKRLRKSKGAGIRFFACGEYGPKLGRPHYHLCIFNYRPDDLRQHQVINKKILYTSETLDHIWDMGFTLTGELTFQSAAYVARYIMKKVTGAASTPHYEMVDPATGQIFTKYPEFIRMSRRPGIGQGWYNKYSKDVKINDTVVIKGKQMRPPRYYDKQFEITDPADYNRTKSKRVRNARQHADDNTPQRRRVRQQVLQSKLTKLPRNL